MRSTSSIWFFTVTSWTFETTCIFDELPVLAAVFVHVNRVLDCPSDGTISLYNAQTTGRSGHFMFFDGTSSCSSVARCHMSLSSFQVDLVDGLVPFKARLIFKSFFMSTLHGIIVTLL